MDRSLTEDEFKEWHDGWVHTLDRIKGRTGMPDPTLFFDRMLNANSMIEQMKNLKVVSDFRLQELREEYHRLDDELEELQYDNSMVGVASSSSSSSSSSSQTGGEQQKHLIEARLKEKKAKERAESANELVTKVMEGLHHIGDTLNLEVSSQGSVSDLLHTIEGVLEVLMEEKEKAEQQTTDANSHLNSSIASSLSPSRSHMHGGRDSTTSMDGLIQQRPTELDVILHKFEAPQTRLASKLPFHVGEERNPSPSYLYGAHKKKGMVDALEEEDIVDDEELSELSKSRSLIKSSASARRLPAKQTV
jgi:hypothetical protein